MNMWMWSEEGGLGEQAEGETCTGGEETSEKFSTDTKDKKSCWYEGQENRWKCERTLELNERTF